MLADLFRVCFQKMYDLVEGEGKVHYSAKVWFLFICLF